MSHGTKNSEQPAQTILSQKEKSLAFQKICYQFPSGSTYEGDFDKALKCFVGYGVYTYPDGSVYRGYFSKGKFHGLGTMELSAPYNFIFRGLFKDGSLETLHNMWFGDELEVKTEMRKNYELNFANWLYCTKEDRRYAVEHTDGIPPVGPSANLTAKKECHQLNEKQFDVGEGIYHASTGTISGRPPPFPPFHVATCENNAWILKNCRRAALNTHKDLSPRVCHKIINKNLDQELELAEYIPNCNFDHVKQRKQYFSGLCTGRNRKQPKSPSVPSIDPTSTSETSNFDEVSLNKDPTEQLVLTDTYGNTTFGNNPDGEAQSLVVPHFHSRNT